MLYGWLAEKIAVGFKIVKIVQKLKPMIATSFQDIIESIEQLSIDDQNYLFELIQKRRIEKRRLEIAANAKATLDSVKQGTAKKGTIDDLMADLLGDEDDEDSLG